MPEHPAEIPAESEGGSGRIDLSRIRGGIGGPNELPPPDLRVSISQLVNEVFRLRNRVHTLESHILAAKMSAGRSRFIGIGGPEELPEGEGGGGSGTGGVIPHEIHEIAELPVTRLVAEFSSLVSRFSSFEKNVSQQLASITQRLDTLKR
jgi:hypothetical protein